MFRQSKEICPLKVTLGMLVCPCYSTSNPRELLTISRHKQRWLKAEEQDRLVLVPGAGSGGLATRWGSWALGENSAGNRGTFRKGDNRLLMCLSWGQVALAVVCAGGI